MTTWTDQRDAWVQGATRKQILRVIAAVANGYETDENPGDWGERAETILWVATRGKKGSEWGHAGGPAEEVGGWVPAPGGAQ